MPKILIVRCGEIMLKGLNRPYFEQKLASNIKKSIYGLGPANIKKSQGQIYIDPADENYDFAEATDRLGRVPGIASTSIAEKLPTDFEKIKAAAAELAARLLESPNMRTFKVETRRGDKTFPLTSPEVCTEVGAYILENVPGISVDVKNPDFRVYIEIRDHSYIYADKDAGIGGLPLGTNGRAMLLLSGGIDSPVAGWMLAKRGVEISAVHFYTYPYTSERSKEKVTDLAQVLVKSCMRLDLHVVPFTDIMLALHEKCPEELNTILMRRAMMRIAETLAVKNDCQALVTGESIGQVASQTMKSLAATDTVVKMPVFRPLIGMDKNDVVKYAQAIGTFDISIRPYEDCCTVFVARHPNTHPDIPILEQIEAGMDELDSLIKAAIDGTETITLKS